MGALSIGGLIIRFLLGGGCVVVSSLLAKKAGSKIGGIFAAFPAVYLAALLTIHLDFTGSELIAKSITLSKGALIGMSINILCAIVTGYVCTRDGWKRGLAYSLFCWFFLSMVTVYLSTAA
ncbi:DUF3147 family protein [Aneurinibacillus terranovensis]|uniref:DUF3147 family protein n=1 Tax=Aneurinibacillus terranovensis TaxID=278991 RepID=UPI000402C3BD|nr:DUF3147 family protein [Aneurinibacillus terranovensis]